MSQTSPSDKWDRRFAHRLERPNSPVIKALPWVATFLITIPEALPRTSFIAISFGFLFWGIFFIGHFPVILLRLHFYRRKLINRAVLTMDRVLMIQSAIAASITLLFMVVPVWTIIMFWICRSDLQQLASRVPIQCVIYNSFGDAHIGVYPIDTISRFPHYLKIDLLKPYCPENWRVGMRSDGISFILEDDKDYRFDNTEYQRLGGNWYTPQPWLGYVGDLELALTFSLNH